MNLICGSAECHADLLAGVRRWPCRTLQDDAGRVRVHVHVIDCVPWIDDCRFARRLPQHPQSREQRIMLCCRGVPISLQDE